MIFSPIRGAPRYGKNAGLVQGLATGPYHLSWAGGDLLPVPGPVATEMPDRAARNVGETPPRACRCHDPTQRVDADATLPCTALLLPQPLTGMGVAEVQFHGPAVASLASDDVEAQGESGGEQGRDRRSWWVAPRRFEAAGGSAPHAHALEESSGPHRVPPPTPGVHLGPHCARVRGPAGLRGGQGLGRTAHVAFFARGPATFLGERGGPRVERGMAREAASDRGRSGEAPPRVLGGRATLREGTERPPRHWLRHASEPGAGQRPSGTIGDGERLGLGRLAIACEAHRETAVVAGPRREGQTHATQHAVPAP